MTTRSAVARVVSDTFVCGPRELERILYEVRERCSEDLWVCIDDDAELHRLYDQLVSEVIRLEGGGDSDLLDQLGDSNVFALLKLSLEPRFCHGTLHHGA
jgi:hypothetical protein